jgi:hypothetical protein
VQPPYTRYAAAIRTAAQKVNISESCALVWPLASRNASLKAEIEVLLGVSGQILHVALWIVWQLAVLGFAALSSSQNASFSVRDDGDTLIVDEVMHRKKAHDAQF